MPDRYLADASADIYLADPPNFDTLRLGNTDPRWGVRRAAGLPTQLVFQGTEDILELIDDADFVPIVIPGFEVLDKIDRGFARGMTAALPDIIAALGQDHYETTGHSLGGARAMIAAAMLDLIFHGPLRVVVFGAPAPGGAILAKTLATRVPGTEYQMEGDPIWLSDDLVYPHPYQGTRVVPAMPIRSLNPFRYHKIAGYQLVVP